ncbi:MAG: M20/M25/M40 family metallo-hydrolase [Candidatus Hodarchaeales archaeon]|jgi:succinyl-diaminopimelate desuccinylase
MKESAITLLSNLIGYKTINNPSDNQYPDLRIISFVRDTLLQWNPEYKFKLFDEKKYSSIYISSDLDTPKDIVFLGHLDVVPITNNWDSNPFALTIKEEKLGFGRGSKDCKGSVVSALLFLKKINRNSKKNSLVDKVGIFLSTDEESGGQFGAQKFFNYAKESRILPKYVINVDGGPKVVFKRRAGFNLRLKAPPLIKNIPANATEKVFETRIMYDNNRHSAYFVPGVDSHALLLLSKFLHLNSQIKIHKITGDWIKGNVIPNNIRATILDPHIESGLGQQISYDENLTKILRSLRSLILIDITTEKISEFGITVNPNILKYSSTEGMELQFDVRAFLSPNEKERLVNAFISRLGSMKDQVQVECHGSSGYFYTNPSDRLVTISIKVMKDYKLMALDESPKEQEGASDARYATMYGIPAIDIGPVGGNIHGDNEFINLESMLQFSTIYENIVFNLLKMNNAEE